MFQRIRRIHPTAPTVEQRRLRRLHNLFFVQEGEGRITAGNRKILFQKRSPIQRRGRGGKSSRTVWRRNENRQTQGTETQSNVLQEKGQRLLSYLMR